ncbi:acid protease [Calocera cornea HHB12733]|uniref:Acid protease n=1 Tax=Calocera cornea HHB12733 TaxID=1353952 RepID=A0A165FU98_9BASI|nr:acid protease [Calocera cornea HHB12733]
MSDDAEPTISRFKRNHKWQRNGKMDYARSVRKWNITPSDQTTFHIKDGKLLRHHTPPAAGFVPSDHAPPITETGHLHTTHKPYLMEKIATTAVTSTSATIAVPAAASSGPVVGPGESEVPATGVQNDLEFVVPVTIGTPGVTAHLDFDTGSADLWVWGPQIQADRTKHTLYDPAASQTGKSSQGLWWRIQYGDGSVAAGEVHTDVINLGGVALPNQSVQVATALSDTFISEDGSDGLLGLAFPNMNTVQPMQQVTPMANLVAENLLVKPIFTVKLDKDDASGFYTFGDIAPDSHTGIKSADIKYQPVITTHGFWEFTSPTIRVGDKLVKREANNTAIADTGTTILMLSDAACQLVYSQIPGAVLSADAGGWILPSNSTPPHVGFGFGPDGLEYTISGEDLKYGDMQDGTHYGAIQSRGQAPYDILGDVFLRRVYAIFDQSPGAPKIGFAQRSLE